MASMTTGGTPDYYYDHGKDLWVEYKALGETLPKLLPEKALPTALQRAWLDRRFANGGNAVVAVGLKVKSRVHGFFLNTPIEWSTRWPREWYLERTMPVKELAEVLMERMKCST